MRLRCKTIASCGNKHIHRAELINVTFNSDQRQQDMLDGLVRNIYYLYNTVFIINFDENSCNPIVASASSWEFLDQKTYGLEEVRLTQGRTSTRMTRNASSNSSVSITWNSASKTAPKA